MTSPDLPTLPHSQGLIEEDPREKGLENVSDLEKAETGSKAETASQVTVEDFPLRMKVRGNCYFTGSVDLIGTLLACYASSRAGSLRSAFVATRACYHIKYHFQRVHRSLRIL